jgi:hypothetical protein
LIPIPVEKVKEYLELNKKGVKVQISMEKPVVPKPEGLDFTNVVGQESLTRFDSTNKKNKKKKHRRPQQRNEPPKTGQE